MMQTTSAGSAPRPTDRGLTIRIGLVLLAGLLIGAAASVGVGLLQGTPEEFAVEAAVIPEYFTAPLEEPPPSYGFGPGEYRLFYTYEVRNTTVDYSLPGIDPNMVCSITNVETGATIPLEEATSFSTVNTYYYQGAAVGAFTITQQGAYAIKCAAAAGTTTPEVELMVGQITGFTRLAASLRPALPLLAWVLPLGAAAAAAAFLQRRAKKLRTV